MKMHKNKETIMAYPPKECPKCGAKPLINRGRWGYYCPACQYCTNSDEPEFPDTVCCGKCNVESYVSTTEFAKDGSWVCPKCGHNNQRFNR